MPGMGPCPNGSLGMSQLNNKDVPKLQRAGDYPLGVLESRAAARAECARRERILDESAVVVIMTGLPRLFGEQAPVIDPPDFLTRYKMPDGSTVDVIRRHWGGPQGRGV